jgi:DNA-binding beta-propeller fold protein YncE
VGVSPQFIAFDSTNLWVTNLGNNNLTKPRDCDGAVLGTFPVGEGPVGIAFDGASVWTTNNLECSVSKR